MTKYESFSSGLCTTGHILSISVALVVTQLDQNSLIISRKDLYIPRHIPRTSNAVEFISGQATISCARRHDFLHFYADIFDKRFVNRIEIIESNSNQV